jgi:CheY-like chemotaxis protein/two-component sensor histidine kinase
MKALPPDEAECVEQVLKAGRHLLGLIDEVLDISRIEAGHLRLSLEPVAVGETLGAALAIVRPLATNQGIELTADVVDARYVRADRQRLQQVLLNLLSNAIKYNRPGGRVTVATEEMPDRRLALRITDTGQGIASDQLERLFIPFERLGAEATAVEGTGLGLALSKHLVELMGGMLGVESRVGEGSTFVVTLPLVEAPTAALDAADAQPATGPERRAGRLVVLSIEDNLSNLQLIERVFAAWPETRVLSALLGRLGLDLAREHRPDVILLDLHLPDLPGEEVLKRLRAEPRTCAIPVVVLSADAMPGQIERLLAAGARAYLTKPLDVRRLREVVEDVTRPEASDQRI